jgi:hypothetical protein
MLKPVRCGDGRFYVGHVFTTATRYKKCVTKEDFEKPAVIEEQRSVSITVNKIHMQGFEFNGIGHGMTCVLELDGVFDFDPEGWCLGTESDFMEVIVK